MKYRKIATSILALFLMIAFALPVDAARYQRLTVSELIVEKSARINGLLQAAANTTGNVWYVDSGSGVDGVGAQGKSSKTPFATLDYAIGRATANNDDYILVMAGHAESGTAADLFDVDVSGLTIVGMGYGEDMPEFTFADTDTTVAIGATNTRIYNLSFLAGISAVVIGVAVEAGGDYFLLSDCWFPEPTTSTFEFIDAIDLAAGADGVTIENCIFYNMDATGGSHFIEAGNGANARLTVRNNLIMGEFAVSAIWSDAIDLEALIEGNDITNPTNGQHAIEFTTTATGTIRDNLVRTDAQGTAIDPGSMSMHNNYWDSDAAADTVAVPVVSGGPAVDALLDIHLDHVMALDGATQIYPETAVNDSTVCKILGDDDPASCATYNNATDSLEAIGAVTSTLRTTLVTKSAITSSSIPNNTQTAGAITGAASGGLWLEDIIVQCDATGWAAPTNIEFTTDNAKGPTGAAAPICLEVIGSFGANSHTECIADGTSTELPYYLETGKKVFIHGDNAAGTGGGVCDVIMRWTGDSVSGGILGSDLP
jgi:hypothetical protein